MARTKAAKDPKDSIVQQLTGELREARIQLERARIERDDAVKKAGRNDPKMAELERNLKAARDEVRRMREERARHIAEVEGERDQALAQVAALEAGVGKAIDLIAKSGEVSTKPKR